MRLYGPRAAAQDIRNFRIFHLLIVSHNQRQPLFRRKRIYGRPNPRFQFFAEDLRAGFRFFICCERFHELAVSIFAFCVFRFCDMLQRNLRPPFPFSKFVNRQVRRNRIKPRPEVVAIKGVSFFVDPAEGFLEKVFCGLPVSCCSVKVS